MTLGTIPSLSQFKTWHSPLFCRSLLKLRDLISNTKDLDGKFEMLVDAVSQASSVLFWNGPEIPCQIYHVKIQVETESDAKVAKTLVFANSKWESLANLQPGWNQCASWCLHIVSSSGWISTPRFVDEGNPPDIFLLQVSERYVYIYTMIQTEKDHPVGHSGHLKKDTSLGMFCQGFFCGD